MTASMLAAWLLPPLLPLLVALAGCFVLTRRPRTGRALIVGGIGVVLLLSMPLVGGALLTGIEPPYADPLEQSADAIVILGGGSYRNAPEYGHDTVNSASLERLRYGALIYKRSTKPILVTGGNPLGNATPEAAQMRAVLEEEWRIPVRWSEETSGNTFENARNSYTILNRAGIKRIYLITHAFHMPRSRRVFEAAGFTVIAAPTRFATAGPIRASDFLPSADGFLLSARFCHEGLGLVWYRLKTLLKE
ncbi:MAG: hypothetical protein JWN94_2463 [Betaproteobacteria bacterium]|nr:hypothetical protein [Betaproteobacteria bacterium]